MWFYWGMITWSNFTWLKMSFFSWSKVLIMNLNIFYHLIKFFETFQLIKSFINGIFAFKKFRSTAKICKLFFGSWSKLFKSLKYNPGGLDVRDQSRSRSRTSITSRLTFENGRDYPSRLDQLFFFSRSRFLKSRLFSRDFVASRFLSRLSRFVKIVEICQDLSRRSQDLSRCSRDLSRNLDEKIQKSMRFSIKIETNCRETPKFSDLDEFLDRDFLVWTLMSRLNREISIVKTNFWKLSRLSITSRLILFGRRDRESRSRPRRDNSRPPGLLKYHY